MYMYIVYAPTTCRQCAVYVVMAIELLNLPLFQCFTVSVLFFLLKKILTSLNILLHTIIIVLIFIFFE